MEVHTDEPEPDVLPEMPRRVQHGDEVQDDRLFQDVLNAWREVNSDHVAQETS